MKRYIKSSAGSPKVTGKTWSEFIENIESQTKYKVDAAFKRDYDPEIYLLDRSDVYQGAVTKYFGGSYEMMLNTIEYVGPVGEILGY